MACSDRNLDRTWNDEENGLAFDIVAILTKKSLKKGYLLNCGMGETQNDTKPYLVQYKALGATSDTQPILSGLEVCQMVSLVRESPVMCKLSRRINAWLMKFSHAVRGVSSQVRNRSFNIIAVLSTFEYHFQDLSIFVVSAHLSTAIESSSLLSKSHVFQPRKDKTTMSDSRSFWRLLSRTVTWRIWYEGWSELFVILSDRSQLCQFEFSWFSLTLAGAKKNKMSFKPIEDNSYCCRTDWNLKCSTATF